MIVFPLDVFYSNEVPREIQDDINRELKMGFCGDNGQRCDIPIGKARIPLPRLSILDIKRWR